MIIEDSRYGTIYSLSSQMNSYAYTVVTLLKTKHRPKKKEKQKTSLHIIGDADDPPVSEALPE